MENESNSSIELKHIFKLVGVGVFMFWFLSYLDSSISGTLKIIFIYLPIEFNFNTLIAYPVNEFISLGIILFLFFKLVKNIKQNYENEIYLKKMIVLFIIGISLLLIYLLVSPSAITFFFTEVFDFDINESYDELYIFYVKLGFDILTFTIKLIVLAYVFLKNRNFQNSSASS